MPDSLCPIRRAALVFLGRHALEGRAAPTLRAVNLMVAPEAEESAVHAAVLGLRNDGLIELAELHTGRVIIVHLTGAGRTLAERLVAAAGIRLDPVKRRRCLSCRHRFASAGAHNRICDDCKGTVVWRGSDMAPLHA